MTAQEGPQSYQALEASASDSGSVYVNGKKYELPSGRGETTLLTWLRGEA